MTEALKTVWQGDGESNAYKIVEKIEKPAIASEYLILISDPINANNIGKPVETSVQLYQKGAVSFLPVVEIVQPIVPSGGSTEPFAVSFDAWTTQTEGKGYIACSLELTGWLAASFPNFGEVFSKFPMIWEVQIDPVKVIKALAAPTIENLVGTPYYQFIRFGLPVEVFLTNTKYKLRVGLHGGWQSASDESAIDANFRLDLVVGWDTLKPVQGFDFDWLAEPLHLDQFFLEHDGFGDDWEAI